jgi:hypothetical protein
MRQAFEVKYQNGATATIVAFYPDFIVVEEKYDVNPIVTSWDQFRLKYNACAAWAALTREKQINQPFDEWLASVENVKALDEEEFEATHVPLESSQPTGS